jgi:hypothetical protein
MKQPKPREMQPTPLTKRVHYIEPELDSKHIEFDKLNDPANWAEFDWLPREYETT